MNEREIQALGEALESNNTWLPPSAVKLTIFCRQCTSPQTLLANVVDTAVGCLVQMRVGPRPDWMPARPTGWRRKPESKPTTLPGPGYIGGAISVHMLDQPPDADMWWTMCDEHGRRPMPDIEFLRLQVTKSTSMQKAKARKLAI